MVFNNSFIKMRRYSKSSDLNTLVTTTWPVSYTVWKHGFGPGSPSLALFFNTVTQLRLCRQGGNYPLSCTMSPSRNIGATKPCEVLEQTLAAPCFHRRHRRRLSVIDWLWWSDLHQPGEVTNFLTSAFQVSGLIDADYEPGEFLLHLLGRQSQTLESERLNKSFYKCSCCLEAAQSF